MFALLSNTYGHCLCVRFFVGELVCTSGFVVHSRPVSVFMYMFFSWRVCACVLCSFSPTSSSASHTLSHTHPLFPVLALFFVVSFLCSSFLCVHVRVRFTVSLTHALTHSFAHTLSRTALSVLLSFCLSVGVRSSLFACVFFPLLCVLLVSVLRVPLLVSMLLHATQKRKTRWKRRSEEAAAKGGGAVVSFFSVNASSLSLPQKKKACSVLWFVNEGCGCFSWGRKMMTMRQASPGDRPVFNFYEASKVELLVHVFSLCFCSFLLLLFPFFFLPLKNECSHLTGF